MGGLNCPGGEILGSGLGVGSDSDVERGGGVVAVVVLGFWFGGEVVLERVGKVFQPAGLSSL